MRGGLYGYVVNLLTKLHVVSPEGTRYPYHNFEQKLSCCTVPSTWYCHSAWYQAFNQRLVISW